MNFVLVEFRVKNFRSIRDEQVLSLVASKDKTLRETHTVTTGVKAVPVLLRSAVIYGGNASGKSNLIKALQFMQTLVATSATIQPAQTFNLQRFRLDTQSTSEPTTFEVTFLLEGVRYQYGIALTPERIVGEHLLVYKAFKPQRWFERRFDAESGKDVYEFGAGLKGPKNVWEQATRPNSLFLSMAVQLNSEPLRPIFDWFAKRLVIVNEAAQLTPQFSVQMLEQPDKRKAICQVLAAADLSIADVDVVKRKVTGQSWTIDIATGKQQFGPVENEVSELKFHHVTEHGNAVFDLTDESSGTRSMLFLAGPVLDILDKGLTLLVDELDTSLHTLLVREIVRLFHQPSVNTHGAQLIFTTHDTSLLDAPDLFRRDQIWFVEKDRAQASALISLSEFSPRKNEALERGYLMGRYGGVPFLSHNLGLDN